MLLTRIAAQQADYLMSESLQLDEAIRRSLIKNGETEAPLPAEPPKHESRDVYDFPELETLEDRLAALQQTHDLLLAQKFHLQETINSYNFYTATQAQSVERNDRLSDERKERLERSFTRNFQNERNEEDLRSLEQVDREIEGVEKEIEAQESAVKEHQAIASGDQEDTQMTEAECLVCFEAVTETITPRLCQHRICTTCTHNYIFTTKQMILPASCPAETNCPGQIDLDLLHDHFSSEDQDKLYRHALEKQLIDAGEAMYCSNARCGEILEVANGDDDEVVEIRVECPSCHTRMCSSCKVAWHNGFTCEAYQRLPEADRSEADLTLLTLARVEEWKRCPRCRTMISLTTGCNHMTCRCSFEFCYVCLAQWNARSGCPTGCPLWDERRIAENPIVDPPVVNQPFVQAARARIPARQDRADRLHNPPRGINLADLDVNRLPQQGILRRSIETLTCMYCERSFGQLGALNRHLNFTQQHEVLSCCGKVFPNEHSQQQHRNAVHGGYAY